MSIPPSSSTDNEENTMLEPPNATENTRLVPTVALTTHKGKKCRCIGMIITAILASITGIILVGFIVITKFRNPEYKIDTYIVFVIGSAAFYVFIPLSSIYVICMNFKNRRDRMLNGSNTAPVIDHTTSMGTSTSRDYGTIQNIKRILTNVGPWEYGVAVIFVVLSSALDIVGDSMEIYDEFSNLTVTTFWPQKAWIISRILPYGLTSFLIIYTLCWVLLTYRSFAKETDRIKQWFTGGTNDIEKGIATIKVYSENMLTKRANWKENHSLENANFFASFYVICGVVWTIAYAYEVIRRQQTITKGVFLNSTAHFLSYGSLVIIMWWTNKKIDEMKETALLKMSLVYKNTTTDLVFFKTFLAHYDPYASLCTKKTNLPDIVKAALPGIGSLILTFIKSRLQW